jgi:hypothetical protein
MFMRLVPVIDRDLLLAMRPVTGDLVQDIRGNRYTVKQAGMRYFVVAPADNPKAEVWFKHNEVRKVEEEPAFELEPEGMNYTDKSAARIFPDSSMLYQ